MKRKLLVFFLAVFLLSLCTLGLSACSHRHDLTHYSKIEATCTESGKIEYWYCADCEKYFSDETGKNEISSSSITVAALGHDVSQEWLSDENNHWHECTRCHEKSDIQNHDYADGLTCVCGEKRFTKGLEYSLSDDGQYYILVGTGEAQDAEIYVSETVNGKPVREIAATAFANNDKIVFVYVPQSVQTIKSGSFVGCNSLESLTLPYVDKFLGHLFGAERYNDNSYYVPASLTTLTVNGNICDYAFFNCSNVSKVNLGSEVESIGVGAFQGCGITEITIPDSVAEIGNGAFSKCLSLKSATIGNGVDRIADSAFSYCAELESVSLSSGVKSIESMAFYQCYKLQNINIPDTVQQIGNIAFGDCQSLINITIPKSVTSIGGVAFMAYNFNGGIRNINYDGSIADWLNIQLGEGPFMCPGWTLYIDGKRLEGELIIPEGLKSIPSYAFAYYDKITSVIIPDSVQLIGDYAFEYCDLISVKIGGGVNSIGSCAFYRCESLASVFIPDSVTSIGVGAFYFCENLSNVTFENPENWCVTVQENGGTAKVAISSDDLSDSVKAAELLGVTYCYANWKRAE